MLIPTYFRWPAWHQTRLKMSKLAALWNYFFKSMTGNGFEFNWGYYFFKFCGLALKNHEEWNQIDTSLPYQQHLRSIVYVTPRDNDIIKILKYHIDLNKRFERKGPSVLETPITATAHEKNIFLKMCCNKKSFYKF